MPSLFQTILSKVTDRLTVQKQDLSSVAECITAVTHVPVDANQLCIKKGTLYVQVSPTLKLAILSRKDEILKQCKEKLIGVYAIG
jgi:hypothetical protein